MRIRGRKPTSDCSVSVSPPPPPSPSLSSFSSYSSSITAAHSLVSSEDSSNFCPFSLLSTASHRCHGLNLLVKAIHQVNAGSVVGVPYIQRRVTIRRRRRRQDLDFSSFMFDEFPDRKRESIIRKKVNNVHKTKKKKQRNVLMELPSSIQDSVFQPWGRRSDISGEVGFRRNWRHRGKSARMALLSSLGRREDAASTAWSSIF